MTCDSVRDMLGACLDGELDANAEFQLRTHLADCPECQEAYRQLRSLKDAIRKGGLNYSAPPELKERIRISLGAREHKRSTAGTRLRPWMSIAASLTLALLLGSGFFVSRRNSNAQLLAQELVSSHVRAMIGTHLVDVPSSDQHTVKPWFNGKLDYSPPVTELRNAGFALVGGRIDYIDKHPAAALIYERRKHVIDVFVWPTARNSQPIRLETLNGYNVIGWTDAGMTFWAVSDLNRNELQQLVALMKGPS
jgi:mycothiol system anti-sigma-R factor